MKSKTLTDLFIRKLKEPGVYRDRDGLRLRAATLRQTATIEDVDYRSPRNCPPSTTVGAV